MTIETKCNVNGDALFHMVEQLYPICRSITGDGVRQTLDVLSQLIPLTVHEVPSGTRVLDWTVPEEWNIRDAWIKDGTGQRVVDFRESNLHVVGYSVPVHGWLSNKDLQAHLYSLPEHSQWIPYRRSYYVKDWGFCLSDDRRKELTDAQYEVYIDSEFSSGQLTYGELLLAGERKEEFLFSSHICHPSLANDNLSGVVLAAYLANHLARQQHRWSYRFIFAPGTIGAIAWLARNREGLRRIQGGLTLVCLGDREDLTYKRSFLGNTTIDRAAVQTLRDSGRPYRVVDFTPDGYDERQYNSPGFRLAVGSLSRSRYGEFPEYHTSADNLSFVSGQQLMASFEYLLQLIDTLEHETYCRSRCPDGEPQLGRHGIATGTNGNEFEFQTALLWVLALADGDHSLLDMAERSKLPFRTIERAARILREKELLDFVASERSSNDI